MKTFTAKVIEATADLSDSTYKQSMETVERLTNPPPKVARVGSTIGGGVGVALVVAGTVGLLSGAVWGTGTLIAGGLTIGSNLINIRRVGTGK